ncbi:hypothetical protein [Kordiimonas sp. SCSIO 12610]|uniref:hypothetical protein n=1 Tax=Kordiimonas sp. SCSIO 12610 TaxID=2829597 RepID=UPI0021094271|nr:hypothetical protein [Kordiimonas sp. SCSIO 12610]UTW54282.1 hypothetical protein KFF44_10675 [Kordiimonas sp. SCSIO 12610]
MQTLECDYLVIGAGAAAMAFVDVMLSEGDATFIVVDNHAAPGGHWNDAYPFVRLHQPSSFYGVSSMELGSGRIDTYGSNKGYYELASGAEILAYFDRVMREVFIPSGRVQYYPMHEYIGGHSDKVGNVRSVISGEEFQINVRAKTVDSTFFKTSVPSTHQRKYSNADGVTVIPPNDLAKKAPHHKSYCVIGGGKTAMDTIVWLMDNGANAQDINWVCPRGSWLINRAGTQPGQENFEASIGGFAAQMEAAATAVSPEDLFLKLEAAGVMLRIDEQEMPSMVHYATISKGEVDVLRQISNVIKGKRVNHITEGGLVMQDGQEIDLPAATLYIDCTASAVEFLDKTTKPMFTETLITIQAVRAPLVSYSAAVVGYVEAHYDDDKKKNALCTPIMLSDTMYEWMVSFFGNMLNQNAFSGEKDFQKWSLGNRLDPFGTVAKSADMTDPKQAAIMMKLRDNAMPAAMNLQKLIAEGAD